MGSTKDSPDENLNPFVKEVGANLENLIEGLNCLRESYGFSEGMLNQQKQTAYKKYEEFVKAHKIDSDSEIDDIDIPQEYNKEFTKLKKKKRQADRSFDIIPRTYIVSLISLFDSYFAGLVRCVYKLKPVLLQNDNKEFFYRDLMNYESIKEIKQVVIDGVINTLLRDSHIKQIEWLEKALEVESLKKFEDWGNFIELTERRNLFVHSDGVVSTQYITICKNNGYKVDDISTNTQLHVDRDYFDSSYRVVYSMGIMLTQIMLNKLYVEFNGGDTADRDKILITNVFDLICDKQYHLAIAVSQFSLGTQFKRNGRDKSFIILNMAQAYKWSDNNEKCNEILTAEDTTTWNDELLIPKLSLEEKYDEVFQKMRKLGSTSEILTKSAYREWPIFKKLREQASFKEAFKMIFEEDLIPETPIKVETANEQVDETDFIVEKK